MQALIVNRLHPRFDAEPAANSPAAPAERSGRTRNGGNPLAFADLNNNWAQLCAVAQGEENLVAVLAAQVAPAPVARFPLLADDVHDLDGVETVADHLFGPGDGHRSDNPADRP